MNNQDAQPENESNYEQRLAKIRLIEAIDAKFGYKICKDSLERDAWLVNVQSSEAVDEHTKVIYAVCDFYFLQNNGERFKVSFPFRPYLYVATLPSCELQVLAYLTKRYSGIIVAEIIDKEDLDMKNHLSGLTKKYIKISFPSMNELIKFKKEIAPLLKQNQEREKNSTSYTALLARHFGSGLDHSEDGEASEKIIDMREHDLTYHMRVCIDKKFFVGLWYKVVGLGPDRLPSITLHPTLIDPPEPVVLAYDIEVTKLPLKFPDATIDEIVMISYMIDGQGFLIVNRQVVSADIEDFEYTPKPEFPGSFTVFNEENELAVIKCFFDHILRVRPSIFVTYNGDSFDWPFVETRAMFHGFEMLSEIGFSKDANGEYKSPNAVHMDAFRWVKRDSYLPVGSQNLKACTRAKLRYDPVELDPEEMCPMAKEQPQVLASYSVSDAVATYYLYMKYVHPFVFALCTIIPLGPDDVLRKGSGTLCEALLMVEAFHNNIIFPNKQIQSGNKYTSDGHVIESETYVGGHVEALESGVFRADLPERFRIVPSAIFELKKSVEKALENTLTQEMHLKMEDIVDFNEVCEEVKMQLDDFIKRPLRLENPKIYHLDVGAMYPNIILTNRLQPPAVVTEEDCMACVYNAPDAKCRRMMKWEWRGEILPATKGEYERILQQLENEKFEKPPRPFHSLPKNTQAQIEKKRVQDFCKRAYGKNHLTRNEIRYTAICEREHGFYVDTVRAFRDRRYEYKGLLKKAKAALEAVPEDDVDGAKKAQGRVVLYDSLQLAHKCILNSFYGYVMRKGSRWFSMEMAGIVCHTGANIITEARKIVEKIGKPLELDTDGIWCLIPSSFPENITFSMKNSSKKKVVVSYPGAILNEVVREKFTNDQYHEIQLDGSYRIRPENSIFFEVDGPYLAMILPASKEEGKKLKKRYAVFNFDKSLAELKGFEVKRRGELAIIKYFQTSVFKAFLEGKNHEECYANVAKEADHWLDVLFTKGADLSDSELFDLISENRSMSKKLDDYGGQKSTSISTAKRLAEFLGDDMVKDAGLACQFIISRKPIGSPVTERAIPVAIFQAAPEITAHYLRKWTKDHDIKKDNINIRNIIDWDYYLERVGGTIQKIISIPAALQNVPNPVPRIPLPEWLENKRRQKVNDHTQRKITDIFKTREEIEETSCDIEEVVPCLPSDYHLPSRESTEVLKDASNVINKVIPRKRPRIDNGENDLNDFPSSKKTRNYQVEKKTILRDGVVAWIKYLKEKWKSDWEDKRTRKLCAVSKTLNSLHTLVERGRRNLYEKHWQLIQVTELPEKGLFAVWAIVHGRMTKLNVRVPRIFYVNDRGNSEKGVLVKRTLPRMKQPFNLYKYSIEESRFQSSLNELNRELCAMRVEGIYETQTPLLFRTLLEIGCCCKLKEEAKNALVFKSISLDDLEMATGIDYLPEERIRNLFYYEHRQDTRCVMAIFNVDANEALVIIVNKVQLEVQNLSAVFNAERARLDENVASLVKTNDIKFDVHQYTMVKEAERKIQKYLQTIRQSVSSPTFLAVLSNDNDNILIRRVPALGEYPLVRIHCSEPAGLFNVLDWHRIVCKRIIQHYMNSFIYLHDYIEVCRYLQIPLGNIPSDWSLFAADLFYARNLSRLGYVLWASPTVRPDLGGKELDDCRLGADWESLCVTEQPISVFSQESFETDVCVELELGAVAVTAIIQSARINEAEGGTDSTGFISDVLLAADSLLGRVKTIAHYDEAAAVSGSMKVLRLFLQDCVKDIHLNANKIADQVVVNLHRWLLSSQSLLYDPAITRAVDILIRKLCLLLVAEINRLGGKVLYASSSRFVICTNRRDMEQGHGFVNGLIQTLQKNPLFAALHVSPVKYWNIFMWLDAKNYAGIEFNKGEEADEATADKLSVADFLPEELSCRETFLLIVLGYMQLVARKMKSTNDDDAVIEYRKELVSKELSERLFRICSKLFAANQTLTMPDLIACKTEIGNVSLCFAKIILKLISLDTAVTAEVEKLRYQLYRLLGVTDSSAEAEWTPLGVSCTISQFFCLACSQSNDLEACQEEPWACASCKNLYSPESVEEILLQRVNQLVIAYTLQDVKCTKCGSTKRDAMSQFCECSGPFENLIEEAALKSNLRVFSKIAARHELSRLQEACEWVLL